MKDWHWLAPVIASLIAAFVGSFFGALFKEQLTDTFYIRRRKREIRALVSKEIVMFIYILIQHVQIKNFVETLMIQKRILDQFRENTDDSVGKEEYIKEIFRITDMINVEVERDEKLSIKISETQANIHSLIVEVNHYIKKKNTSHLLSLVKEIQSERHTRQMIVDLYDGDDLAELISFRDEKLPQLTQQLIAKKELRIDYYITSIHSLIKVS